MPTSIRMSPMVCTPKPCVDTVEIPNLRMAPSAIRRSPAPIVMVYLLM